MAKKKHKKKLKKRFLVLFIILGIIAIISTALFCVVKFVPNLNFLTIKAFEVAGDSPYNEQTIIDTSGISLGVSMLQTDFSDAEEKIEEQLPYIKNVDISYSLNGTLTFNTEVTTLKYQIKRGTFYYYLDENNKIIDKTQKKNDNIVLLFGVSFNGENTPGKYLEFEENNKLEIFNNIIKLSKTYGCDFDIIDLEDEKEISCVYENKFFVRIGTNDYLDEKIKRFSLALKELDEQDVGVIRLDKWTPENRKSWLSSQNIDELIEKY